jgi:hypothetical protein
MSSQRLSEPVITNSGAMRVSTAQVPEGNEDALNALKRTEEMYRTPANYSSKPCDAGNQQCIEERSERLNIGEATLRPAHASTASVSTMPVSQQAPTNNGGAQLASMWDPDDEEFDRWPGQET